MELWMPCPNCGRTDKKYSFNTKKNVGFCFVCGYKQIGNTIALETKITEKKEEPIRRTIKHIHNIYSRLFDILELKKEHAHYLILRGFPRELLQNYRSLYPIDVSRYFYWHEVSGIPGFYNREYIQIVNMEGILIPNRSPKGLIRSIQIRHNNKKRYSFFSSRDFPEGTKAIAYPHWVMKKSDVVYLTEGPLKADLSSYILGTTFCSVPGVNNHNLAVYEVFSLGLPCIIALDMDMYNNKQVARAFMQIVKKLQSLGVKTYHAYWNKYKGIDDALLEGEKIHVKNV